MTIGDALAGLSDDDQLSLFVGRVARTNALLEYDLGNVWRTLGGEAHPAGAGVDQLANDCRRLLRKTYGDHLVVDAGLKALSAARRANSIRNRVVHDIWLEATISANTDGGSWQPFRLTAGQLEPAVAAAPVTVDVVAKAHESLRRARTRVSGLFMALHGLANQEAPTHGRAPKSNNLDRYLAMMNDHFELHDNGDIDITADGRSG